MAWLITGLLSGLVLGLTGAGGAIVATPILVHVLGYSIRDMTIMSLIIVLLGSIIQLVSQWRDAHPKLAIIVAATSIAMAFLARHLKVFLPDFGIVTALLCLVTWSLWNIWKSPDKNNTQEKRKSRESVPRTIGLGMLLGCVTVFTGLGGGVILVPAYLKKFGSQREAVATSLFTIAVATAASFFLQWRDLRHYPTPLQFFILLAGLVLSARTLIWMTTKLKPKQLSNLRRWTFTFVALVVASTLIAKLIR